MPLLYCNPAAIKSAVKTIMGGRLGEIRVTIDDPNFAPAYDEVTAEIRSKLGHFWSLRTARAMFGDEGAVRVWSPVMIIMNKAATYAAGFRKEFTQKVMNEPFKLKWYQKIGGISGADDQAIFDTIMNMDASGRYIGPVAATSTAVHDAARALREMVDRYGAQYGIRGYKYSDYRRAIHANNDRGRVLWDDTQFKLDFVRDLTPEEADFFAYLERQGSAKNWDPTARNYAIDFIESLTANKVLIPEITKHEREAVIPFFGAKYYQKVSDGSIGRWADDKNGMKAWEEFKKHLYGHPTPADIEMMHFMQQLKDSLHVGGPPLDARSTHRLYRAISNLFYSGVLSAPGATVRQLYQLSNSYAELGVRPLVVGMSALFDDVYKASLFTRGVLTPAHATIHEQIGAARKVGRVISSTTEAALTIFETADQAMRVITAKAADFAFDEALTSAQGITSLRAKRELKDQIVKLVNQNKIDEARDLYAVETIAKTQFFYGATNRPAVFRGSVMQAVGMLQNYPWNLGEMYIDMAKRFARGVRGEDSFSEALPLIRQLGVIMAVVMGGKEAFGTNLLSNFVSFPGLSPLVQTAGSVVTVGKTNLEWMGGAALGLGEQDYHKRLRYEGNRELMRQAINFIPGGLPMRQSWDLIVDGPTFGAVMKTMGFPPLAEEANLEARAKAAETRRRKAFEFQEPLRQ